MTPSPTPRSSRRRRHRLVALLLLIGTLPLAPQARATEAPVASGPSNPAPPAEDPRAPADPKRIVATWEAGRLTAGELAAWLARSHGERGDRGIALEIDDAEIEEAARELAFRRSLASRALAKGLDRTPSGRIQLEARRHAVLVPLLQRHVVSRVEVSDAEVAAFYRDHPDAYRKPRKLKLRNIYLEIPPGTDPAETLGRIERIRQSLLDGADFEAMAERTSDSQTASRGGALGWVDPETVPPEVTAVVADLEAGALSQPVRHGDGVSLFLCEEVREAVTPTPAEVRAEMRRRMENQRRKEVWEAHREGLLAAASARIDPGPGGSGLALPGYRLSGDEVDALVTQRSRRVGGPLGAEVRARLLRDWAIDVLAAEEARRLGLAAPKSAETRETSGGAEEAADIETVLAAERQEALALLELVEMVRARRVEPTEAELRDFLDRHRRRFREPPGLLLRAIHLGTPESAPPEETRQMIEQGTTLAARIAAGELDFAQAARTHSLHPSAARGGDLGWQSQRQVAMRGPTARRAIEELQPGSATDLLHLDTGLWIFQLRDRRPERDPALAEVEDAVRTAWHRERLHHLEEEIRRDHLAEIGFEIVALRPPATPATPEAPKPRVIRWSTASEFENFGYHVYRGPSEDGPFERLTEEPISGAGTSDVPHSYRFEDPTAEPGVTYWYFVESISTSGQSRRFTPVRPSRGEAEEAEEASPAEDLSIPGVAEAGRIF